MLVSCFLKSLQRFPMNSEQNAYSLPRTYITQWSPCLSSHPISRLSPQVSLSFSHSDSLSSTNVPSSLLLEGVCTAWNLLSPRSLQNCPHSVTETSPLWQPTPTLSAQGCRQKHVTLFYFLQGTEQLPEVLLFICLLIYWPLFSHPHLTPEFTYF